MFIIAACFVGLHQFPVPILVRSVCVYNLESPSPQCQKSQPMYNVPQGQQHTYAIKI